MKFNNEPVGTRARINLDHPDFIKGVKKIMSDKKIINYKTIWVIGQPIDEHVQDAIKTGWQPFGGVSHLWDEQDQSYSYCQAMVKYE